MSTVVKGQKLQQIKSINTIVETDVRIEASQVSGVWLVEGGDKFPIRMVVGVHTVNDAALAYTNHLKTFRHSLPDVLRVFPLVDLKPIGRAGIIGENGNDDWSAFQNAWIEVRL